MNTDALIADLVDDLRPVRRGTIGRRIAAAVAIGAGGALIGVTRFGFRPDLVQAMREPILWIKLSYCGSMGVIGTLLLFVLARPDRRVPGWAAILAVPFAVIGVLAASEHARLSQPAFDAAWFGPSWRVCSIAIAMLAAPPVIALWIAARRFAPVRPRLAGAALGLASGGIAASIYSLHCPEVGVSFVATWYTLGMLVPAAAGALFGGRLLRW